MNAKQTIFDAFADESEAAKADVELAMPDIDDEDFMGMVQEELERIRQKRS